MKMPCPKQLLTLKKCCVLTCGIDNAAEPQKIFFPLPNPATEQARFQRWLSAIARPDLATMEPTSVQNYYVCQRHFKAHPTPHRRPELLDPTKELPTTQGPQPGPSTLPQPGPSAPPQPQPQPRTKQSSNILVYNSFAKQQSEKKQNKKYGNYKDFCLYLYQCCALQYKSLRESLNLLPVGALQRYVRRATAEPGAVGRLLELKVRHMPQRQRDCTLSLGSAQLVPGFYYNIRDDIVLGVCESERKQQRGQAARVAAVAALQGLQADWRLPLAHTQLAALEPAVLVDWLDTLDAELPRNELALHALVAPLEPLYYRAARLRGVSEKDPHFQLNGKKVCFFFDPTSVMQNIRYHLMQSKILYKNIEVKWEHIVEYFDLSQTFKMKLTPNLTESEMLTNGDSQSQGTKGGGGGGGEALRRGVARAMSVLAQLGRLPAGAAHTADFLAGINDAHDLCCSRHCTTKNKLKRPYSGENSENLNLKKSFDFLNEISLVRSEPCLDLDVNFVNAFKINLSSIQLIHSSLQRKSIFQLSTHRLSNCTDFILKQIGERLKRKGGKAMSTRHFIAAFNGVFVAHFMRPNSVVASERKISKFLGLLEKGLVSFKPAGGVLVGRRRAKWLVAPCLYRQLQPSPPPVRVAETYLAGFILGYCLVRHLTCPEFQKHIQDCLVEKEKCLKQQDFFTVSGYESISNRLEYGKVYVIDPPVRFLEFLQGLETVFRAAARGGLAAPVVEQLQAAAAGVTLDSHCDCFPVSLAKFVFLRLRLCLMLRHNNAALRRGAPRGAFSTKGLTFDFIGCRLKTAICD